MSSQTQQIFPFHIRTNKTKRQYSADYKKENPLRILMFVNGLNLTMDSEFQEKAAVIIFIDGLRKFDSTDEENSLKGHIKYSIPLGIELPRDKSIEVFVWNQIDDNFIECEFDLFLDEQLKPFRSESVPLSRDIYNQIVSLGEELFPFRTYLDEVSTKLINMKGYKKLVVLMSASTISPITELVAPTVNQYLIGTGSDTLQHTDVDTSNDITLSLFEDNEVTHIYDLATESIKLLTVSLSEPSNAEIFNVLNQRQSNGSNDCAQNRKKINVVYTKLYDVDESDDPTFNSNVTNILTDVQVNLVDNIPTTKRYLRFTEKTDVTFTKSTTYEGSSNNCTQNNCTNPDGCCITGCSGMSETPRDITNSIVANIFDQLSQNGEASLSFEIKDISSNQWLPFIPSSEFGTITQGEQSISQIGDVTTKSNSNKTYALPSTQTNFRAVLTVTNGIETGVSVEMIA